VNKLVTLVDVGLKEMVAPVAVDADRLTAPLKPPTGITLTVAVPLQLVGVTLGLINSGEKNKPKSGGGGGGADCSTVRVNS